MERNVLKKHIIKSFGEFAKNNGFFDRKGLHWYKIVDGILIAIGFECDLPGYNAGYFVQPLYEFHDFICLSYGNRIINRYSSDCKKYIIYLQDDEKTILDNLNNIENCFFNNIIPELNKITSREFLIGVAEKNEMFLCASFLTRLIAYSQAYCKNADIAKSYFEKYLSIVSDPPKLLEDPIFMLELLNEDPEKAFAYLENNVKRSIDVLKLKVR